MAANAAFGVALLQLARITALPLATPDRWVISSSGLAAVCDLVVLVLLVPLIGPVVEELVFRGLLFRKWRRTLGPVQGLLLSSALFGVLHADHPLPAMVQSVVLALLYSCTRTFWAPLLAHVMNNGLVVAVLLLPRALGTQSIELNLTPAQVALLLLTSLAGLAWFVLRAAATLGAPLPPFERQVQTNPRSEATQPVE